MLFGQIEFPMLFLSLYYFLAQSIDPIDQVTEMINEKKYRHAYDTATLYINQHGLLDANPKLFFLRGQCAYYISKFEDTVKDMSRFITSGSATNEEKKRAYRARGLAQMRLGLVEDAERDAGLSGDSDLLKRVKDLKTLIEQSKQQESYGRWESAINTYQMISKIAISGVEFLISACRCAIQIGDKEKFNEISHKAMQIAPKSPALLEMRGRFFLCNADTDMAAKHFKICRQYASDSSNCTILFKASNTFKENYNKIIQLITKKDYETAKPLIDACEDIAKRRCSANSQLLSVVETLKIKGLIAQGKNSEALNKLNGLLKENPNATDLLLERADMYLKEDDYESAMKDYQQARRIDEHNKRAVDGIDKVSQLIEKEKNVDFYEVLGLKKGSSISQIKDAYRKQVRIWHPDRYPDPVKKREAERKMRNVNRAYDVLTDPEKKQLYDMGQDPENPGMGQGNPGSGFPGGFPFQFFHGGQNIRFEFH